MVDIAPAGVAGHHAAGDGRRGPAGIDTGSVEVHRVAAGGVAAGALDKLALLVEVGRIENLQLVGAAEIIEGGVSHLHVGIVHEHHMAPPVEGRVLRREDDIAGEIGDMHRQVGPRWQVVVPQGLVERDGRPGDAGDGDGLLAGGVGPGAGDHQTVAHLPALRSGRQFQHGVARPRRGGQTGE